MGGRGAGGPGGPSIAIAYVGAAPTLVGGNTLTPGAAGTGGPYGISGGGNPATGPAGFSGPTRGF
jgi:hypothetical protein